MPVPKKPTPDKPPRSFKPGPAKPMKPAGYETFKKADGSWGMRPTRYKPGKPDPALIPKITVTPIQRRIQNLVKKHSSLEE